MRTTSFVALLAALSLLPSIALATDTVEQVIMKCRTNAGSEAAQVTCLEEALRARLPDAPAPNWSGINPDGSAPTQQPYVRSTTGSTTYLPNQPTGLGSEQVRLEGAAEEQRREAYETTEQSRVTDFAYNGKGKLIIILANGQVWKQRDGDLRTVKLRDGDSPMAVVRRGAVTGYRMTFPDLDREITVSRLK